jgi:hypothetical protein
MIGAGIVETIAAPHRSRYAAAMLTISPRHPDDQHPLLTKLAAVLAEAGGDIWISSEANNLVRPRREGDPGSLRWIVEAEGLPNLLHEYLHFVQVGQLAEDHAIDYRLIPFDTSLASGRQLLWSELACCVLSCAYLSDRPERVAPWFAEQLGIVHHFYGFDHKEPFFVRVEALLSMHRHEFEAQFEAARRLAEQDLGPPPKRLDFPELWQEFQASNRFSGGY